MTLRLYLYPPVYHMPGLFIALLLLATPLPSRAAPFEKGKLPYRVKWGDYTVVVNRAGPYREYVRILDRKGRMQREIRDSEIGYIGFVEVTGKGTPELHVLGSTGGAHCCYREYYFTREGGDVRNLLAFDGGNGALREVRDLNGDGRPELIAANDALDSFGGMAHAVSPQLTMVLGWNGSRYVDQTRKYPRRARADAAAYRKELLGGLKMTEEHREEFLRSRVLGLYGSAIATGDEAEAEAWLRKNAPRATLTWLLSQKGKVRRAVLRSSSKISAGRNRFLGGWE
jgi:hypothetical protein